MPSDIRASHTRLLSHDRQTGTKTFFHWDAIEEKATITYDQPDAPYLESNKADFNAASSGWKGDMHRVASIPDALYHQMQKEGYFDRNRDPELKRLRAWLNDRDNRFFRTRPGRV